MKGQKRKITRIYILVIFLLHLSVLIKIGIRFILEDMEKRGPKPQGQVSTIWSSSLAYAVGLIVTDGSLSIDGRHINFTSKDKDLINTFKNCLDLSHLKIGKKGGGYKKGKIYFQVQFGDVLFYKWLLDIGLMPHKSKTIKALAIPDRYFFDFLRGCFDGDGTIYSYWDPRWHSSYMFYSGFVSASNLFLLWLQKKIKNLLNIHGQIINGKRVQILRFAKNDTLKIFNKMYYSKKVPCLKRKFTKMEKIFRIDREHNILPR